MKKEYIVEFRKPRPQLTRSSYASQTLANQTESRPPTSTITDSKLILGNSNIPPTVRLIEIQETNNITI